MQLTGGLISGVGVFNDLTLAGYSGVEGVGTHSLAAGSGGTTLQVNGNLTLTDTANYSLSAGDTIALAGNLIVNDPSFTGGTILLDGPGPQALIGPSSPGTYGFLPSVDIQAKTADAPLTIRGNVVVTGDFVYEGQDLSNIDGVVAAGSDVVFDGANQTITSNELYFGNAELDPPAGQSQTINGIMNVTNLTIGGGAFASLDAGDGAGMVSVTGNLSAQNTSPMQGDALIVIDGLTDQLFAGTSIAGSPGYVPNLLIQKQGGTLTMTGNIATVGVWFYFGDGSDVDASASTVYFNPLADSSNWIYAEGMVFGNVVLQADAGATINVIGSIVTTDLADEDAEDGDLTGLVVYTNEFTGRADIMEDLQNILRQG